ncbi:MAG: hypothetical protein ABI478_06125 [Propionivibrio sp.]
MSGETDVSLLNACDLKLHRTMARLTHNHLIENMYNFVIDIFAPTINGAYGLNSHRMIMVSIVNRDKKAAIAAERHHIATWKELQQ